MGTGLVRRRRRPADHFDRRDVPSLSISDLRIIQLALADRERDQYARGSHPAAEAARLVGSRVADEIRRLR